MPEPVQDPKTVTNTETKPDQANKPAPPPTAPVQAPAPAPAPVANKSLEGYLQEMPPQIREVVQDGLALLTNKKKSLVDKIMAADGNVFTPEMLNNKSPQELECIAALIPAPVEANPMFLANAGIGMPRTNAGDDPPLTAPSMADLFPLNK